jgi:hypothetical protein
MTGITDANIHNQKFIDKNRVQNIPTFVQQNTSQVICCTSTTCFCVGRVRENNCNHYCQLRVNWNKYLYRYDLYVFPWMRFKLSFMGNKWTLSQLFHRHIRCWWLGVQKPEFRVLRKKAVS